MLYFSKMSLSYGSVVEYYLGSEERFLTPRSYEGMLEVAHFHLFAMGMLLLVLTHLMLFVPLAGRTKAWLITLPFARGAARRGLGLAGALRPSRLRLREDRGLPAAPGEPRGARRALAVGRASRARSTTTTTTAPTVLEGRPARRAGGARLRRAAAAPAGRDLRRPPGDGDDPRDHALRAARRRARARRSTSCSRSPHDSTRR